MHLKAVDRHELINSKDFKEKYFDTKTPVVIKGLAKQWPAYNLWDWEYFIQQVGDKKVGVYNNIKSDSYTAINTADGFMPFGEYLKKV
jgi:hypothetical protein